jgi:hypothetical protein
VAENGERVPATTTSNERWGNPKEDLEVSLKEEDLAVSLKASGCDLL